MDSKKIEYLIERLWAIRGSYFGDERMAQKSAWEDVFEFLNAEKKSQTTDF